MHAGLQQPNQAELGKRARGIGPARTGRAAERRAIGRRIPPANVVPSRLMIRRSRYPRAGRRRRRDRRDATPIQRFQRLGPQPRAGLGDARPPSGLRLGIRIAEPPRPLEQTAQHFARGDLRLQRQRDRVGHDHDMRRQVALARAHPPRAQERLLHVFDRKLRRQYAQTEVVRQPRAGGKPCGGPCPVCPWERRSDGNLSRKKA